MVDRMRVQRPAVSSAVVAVIVVVILVIAGVGYYLVISSPKSTSSSTTGSSSTTTTSSTPTVQAPASITVDEIPSAVSVDPSTSFDVPGGEIMQNVYQGLVFYNGRSGSSFVGVLAKSWTVPTNGLNYTFTLWNFDTFSDGTPLNASTIWFSIYRTMNLNNGISSYISQVLSIDGGAGLKGTV